jgi:Zn-dependent protease
VDFLFILITLTILLFSAILHEIAHGYVAERLGDPTARLMGRLTLDPRKHIDPMMSLALPLILIFSGSPVIFGAAKPVPVDPFNLKEGRKDMALVSLAGPLTNVIIAILASFLFKIFPLQIIALIMHINLLLAIFNLLPIPPLDGSKVFALILPERAANAYLSIGVFGIFILFFLLMAPIGGFSLSYLIFSLVSFSESLLGF